MIWDLLNPLRYLWQALSAERTPRQIGWGIALGMLVGLIPKGNLTAWLIGVIILATRVNLGAAMLSGLITTGFSSQIDRLTHGIGLKILSIDRFRAMLDTWYNTPLVPWLSWNNTVVLGSMVLGLALLYPVQHLSELGIKWVTPYIRRSIPQRFLTPKSGKPPTSPPSASSVSVPASLRANEPHLPSANRPTSARPNTSTIPVRTDTPTP